MKNPAPRSENLRRALAQEAARVMIEQGIRDFLFAKRKAAERFGVTDSAVLPKNTEIEAALREHQRLFGGEAHQDSLQSQRAAACELMQRLAMFQPRLTGPVLNGTATEHDPVLLHVFPDRLESVTLKLMDQGVRFELGEKRIRYGAERIVQQPCIRVEFDDQPAELVVFGIAGIRQPPVSPVDGKPMRRADLATVEALMLTTD